MSRHELLREIWGYPDAPTTRSVDNAIARLRKKIEPTPASPRYIHTVHGDGYTITPEGTPRRVRDRLGRRTPCPGAAAGGPATTCDIRPRRAAV